MHFHVYKNLCACVRACVRACVCVCVCVIPRLNINSFIFAVTGNNRCMFCTLMKFRLRIFKIQQFKLLQNFKNAIFPLTSWVTLSKSCQILNNVQIPDALK